jgi:hypothetical protein
VQGREPSQTAKLTIGRLISAGGGAFYVSQPALRPLFA